MRNLAILGLLALELMLIGCGSSTSSTVKTANGTWESALIGSDAGVGVFNFITQFSVGTGGTLSVSYLSFLTTGPCFPISGDTASGSFDVTANGTTRSANYHFTLRTDRRK